MWHLKFSGAPVLKPVVFLVCVLLLLSCGDDDDGPRLDGNWTKIATPSTSVANGAVSFVLNGVGYFGLGYNGSLSDGSSARGYKNDFWSFNGTVWDNDIPAFPGAPREQAVAFALDNKVYVGLGYNGDMEEVLRDFWEFDPGTNAWDSIGLFPVGLVNAVAFVVDNRAFVGTGKKDDGNWENRFWEFNASDRSWPKAPYTTIPGDLREGAFAFVINSTAYIGGGYSNKTYLTDLFLFTPSVEATMKSYALNNNADAGYYNAFATAVGRENAIALVRDGLAYIATGSSSAALSSVYVYNPGDESWREKTGFEGAARTHAVGFVSGNRMILGTGNNGSNYLNDFWELKPAEAYNNLN